jgi:nitronate monooxygenase
MCATSSRRRFARWAAGAGRARLGTVTGGGAFRELFTHPVVVAPMAAGPSTPALVAVAAEAGALGFLAAGYKTATEMEAQIDEVSGATSRPFGVNVFVPGTPTTQSDALRAYQRALAAEAEPLGVTLGEPSWDDDHWQSKIDVLVRRHPAVVSFAMGCPSTEVLRALGDAGTLTMVTVTSEHEARLALDAGSALLCLQGTEAGAHRSTFSVGGQANELGVATLVDRVRAMGNTAFVAAGGIGTREAVAATLATGAIAVQCGTAFLRCPESGANPAYKAALADPGFATTAVTRAFSGRPARGLRNRFMVEHPDAPAAYPEINNLTRPLRAHAAAHHDAGLLSLWAGTGFGHATDRPAAEVLAELGSL